LQALARWLVAQPLNSVLALAATMSHPWLSSLSGVVLVFLVLHQGVRRAMLEAAGAAALLSVFTLLLQARLDVMLGSALSVWVPAALLALLLRQTRSLTLSLQVLWLAMLALLIAFFAVVSDPVAFWQLMLDGFRDMLKEQGLQEQAAALEAEIGELLASQITIFVRVLYWYLAAASLVLGYKLKRQLPGEQAKFGRFRDLNFGRVVALATAVASFIAWLGGWMPLQTVAFVMFAMFSLQGLAIAHWSHGQGFLPTFGLVALYLLVPFLNLVMLMGLAVTGYLDAWFGFRRLRTAK
jgi:hypothetical protein